MRIRRIEQANFRCGEHTMFRTFAEANAKFVTTLTPDDVIVFVSKGANMLLFVHSYQHLDDGTYVIDSAKKRIVGGTWNPLRLRNYAESKGLNIVGLKKFEEHYKALADAR